MPAISSLGDVRVEHHKTTRSAKIHFDTVENLVSFLLFLLFPSGNITLSISLWMSYYRRRA